MTRLKKSQVDQKFKFNPTVMFVHFFVEVEDTGM